MEPRALPDHQAGPSPAPQPLLAALDRALGRLAATVEVVYVRQPLEGVLGDDEVTAAQLRTLTLLSNVPEGEPGLPVGSVASGLRISYPAASKAADRLADRGLAERRRDPGDARHSLVRLTSRGREVVARVEAERRARLQAVVIALGGEGRARDLLGLLEGFVAASLGPDDVAEVRREWGL